jgi:hypothetical protein
MPYLLRHRLRPALVVLAVITTISFTVAAAAAWYVGTSGGEGRRTRIDSHIGCDSLLHVWLSLTVLVVGGLGLLLVILGVIIGSVVRSRIHLVVAGTGVAALVCAAAVFFLAIRVGSTASCT